MGMRVSMTELQFFVEVAEGKDEGRRSRRRKRFRSRIATYLGRFCAVKILFPLNLRSSFREGQQKSEIFSSWQR